MYINSLLGPIRNVLPPFRQGVMLCGFLVYCKLSSPIFHCCFTNEPCALYFSYSPHSISFPTQPLYCVTARSYSLSTSLLGGGDFVWLIRVLRGVGFVLEYRLKKQNPSPAKTTKQ